MAIAKKPAAHAVRDADENLKYTYQTFMKERLASRKEETGRELIRAIFGNDAIAEDPLF